MGIAIQQSKVALRGAIEHAPETIALSFTNNLAYAVGQKPVWEFGYYVGAFDEYDMNAASEARRERADFP